MLYLISNMSGQQQVALLITFLLGVFAGVYLYIAGFATVYRDGVFPSTRTDDGLVVVADMYGDCQAGVSQCPSFQIRDGGRVLYLPTGSAGSVEDRLSLRLSRSVYRDLLQKVSEAPLDSYSRKRQGECISEQGGVDYRYRITWDEKSYVLDTCKTELPSDSDLNEVLLLIWSYVDPEE